ncbi:MAG: methylated-DNA--[protein]-cysteine S-methyltransferase [Candidatus Dormibacteraceae bacterium]
MAGKDFTLERLADLSRVPAPSGLLPAVLRSAGLGYWYAVARSPLGPVFVGHGPQGIAAVRPESLGAAAFEAWFETEHGSAVRPETALPDPVRRAFEARLRGGGRSLPVDLTGRTAFQQSVLRVATTIPRGQVRTYGWVAREVGRPAAVRAVGSALARNPVPLAIPCHRVVPSDLRLGSYSCGGPEAKRAALVAEGLDVERLERLSGAGVRFVGSETTRVFCTPSCSAARRITPRHEVRFRSEEQALAAGYRPCSVCRPVAVAA